MLNNSSGYILINNGIRMEYLALKQAAYPRNTRLRSPIAEFSRVSRASHIWVPLELGTKSPTILGVAKFN